MATIHFDSRKAAETALAERGYSLSKTGYYVSPQQDVKASIHPVGDSVRVAVVYALIERVPS